MRLSGIGCIKEDTQHVDKKVTPACGIQLVQYCVQHNYSIETYRYRAQ